MTFFHDLDLAGLQRQLEQRDDIVVQELGGDGPATHAGELLLGEADILGRLHDPDLVLFALRLDGDHVMAAELVDADVEFVDLDLSQVLDRRPQMVLQAVGRKAEKRVDQAIVTDHREQGLLVIEFVRPDQLRRCVRYVDDDEIFPRQDTA